MEGKLECFGTNSYSLVRTSRKIQNLNQTVDRLHKNEKTFNENINKINEQLINLNASVNDNHIHILLNHFILRGHFVTDLAKSINNILIRKK